MAYVDVSQLANDFWWQQRLAAAAQTEGLIVPPDTAPQWAAEHTWQLAAAPGFGDAYASAVAGGIADPGRNESVISDAMILAAIQALPS